VASSDPTSGSSCQARADTIPTRSGKAWPGRDDLARPPPRTTSRDARSGLAKPERLCYSLRALLPQRVPR
jgi:hypothetical protein